MYRDIGGMAHINVGKSTATRRILYYNGELRKFHKGGAIMYQMG